MDIRDIKKLFRDLEIETEEKRAIYSQPDNLIEDASFELTTGFYYSNNTEVNFNAKLESNLK